VAYPLMRALGFLWGGVLASVALHVVALIVFARALARRFGDAPSLVGTWLLALYPGITYWAALPYSYAAIVPCSLFCMMFLWRLESATSPRRIFWWCALLGALFLAYDLLPFFAPAALLVLA